MKIVSMTPSITETLFALELGDQIVAVSRFCHYPPEVKKLPKAGDLYSPNFELIVNLRPDLVILLTGNEAFAKRLQRVGIKALLIDHNTIDSVLDSFAIIGEHCGEDVRRRAKSLREELESQREEIREKTRQFEPVSVLISIDRPRKTSYLSDVYAAGKNPYFNDILALAGGRNVLAHSPIAVPVLSRETIITLGPDVIIDLTTFGEDLSEAQKEISKSSAVREWQTLGSTVPAIRNGRIYPMLESYMTIPGPRMFQFARKLAEQLHPE